MWSTVHRDIWPSMATVWALVWNERLDPPRGGGGMLGLVEDDSRGNAMGIHHLAWMQGGTQVASANIESACAPRRTTAWWDAPSSFHPIYYKNEKFGRLLVQWCVIALLAYNNERPAYLDHKPRLPYPILLYAQVYQDLLYPTSTNGPLRLQYYSLRT
jgi:hypothetical protein